MTDLKSEKLYKFDYSEADNSVGDIKSFAEDKADILDSILLKIGTYGPKSLFIEITKRSVSL